MKNRQIPLETSRKLKERLVKYRGKTEYSEGKSKFSYRKLSEKINVSRAKISKLVNWDGYSSVDFLSLEDLVALQSFFSGQKMLEIVEKTAQIIPFSNYIEVIDEGKVLVTGELAEKLQDLAISENRCLRT